MKDAQRYLRLCGGYCEFLGGLNWSATDDALEYKDGSTFAFNEEVAHFLEGFASGGRLIHFSYALHVLHLLRHTEESKRLRAAFADEGRPLRNAGAFAAVLCRDVPAAAPQVELDRVLRWLRDPARPIRWYIAAFHDTFAPSEFPPLPPAAFEQEFLRHLSVYNDDEIRCWLRHGRGPIKDAGKALARELPPPRTLAGALAALLDRPRLAGARPFVDQLVSALSLPLRRPAPPELPVGGYADVTTHGPPDRLLLSQFALDELDFLRRYADRELLYFEREEPHARTRHELIVLLDQGVRTWGDVRLVLAAAVLALGKRAARVRLPFLVAATSAGGQVVDPVDAGDETLGRWIEASDLSENPGEALQRVLERPTAGSRDIVLLTHPRNLFESDVRAAALVAGKDTRLLALAVDGHGRASVSEVRHGVPVSIRDFRVNLDQSTVTKPVPAEPARLVRTAWRGDVEPVGYPFRFGTLGGIAPTLFDFDLAGRCLLTAGRDGHLHAWKVDGGAEVEVLPRGMSQGRVLKEVTAVLGVHGGFVVGGRIEQRVVYFHYDLGRRQCAAGEVPGPLSALLDWRYSSSAHSLVVDSSVAIDLATGRISERARMALRAQQEGSSPLPSYFFPLTPAGEVVNSCTSQPPSCRLDPNGRMHVHDNSQLWDSFIPQADGKPALRGCVLLGAQCRGNVLAVKVANHSTSTLTLWLFRGPTGTPLTMIPLKAPSTAIRLSPDGRLLAIQTNNGQIKVLGAAVSLLQTYAGRFSHELRFVLGKHWLFLEAARRRLYLLRWNGGTLEIVREGYSARFGTPGIKKGGAILGALRYDPARFVAEASFAIEPDVLGPSYDITAVSDRFGQVALFNRHQELVCMFFVFRDQLSGWLPDGTSFGPASAAGRPPSAGHLEKFGRALSAASEGRRS